MFTESDRKTSRMLIPEICYDHVQAEIQKEEVHEQTHQHRYRNHCSCSDWPDADARTRVHEQYGGPSADCLPSGRKFNAIAARCAGFGDGIKKYGVATVVDPTTVDLGRNPLLLAEVAALTGLTIICATGIYNTGAYLKIRRKLGGSHEAVSGSFHKRADRGH